MPKITGMRSRRKKTSDLVESYGFSPQAILNMQKMTPYLSLSRSVEAWAKYLLAAESQEERRWQAMGIPLLEEHYGKKVELWKPKAYTFQIPGGRYTPDFFYIFEDGMRLHVETKGSPFQTGYKDARNRIRIASTLFWWERFMMVRRGDKKKEEPLWVLEDILPDKDYQTDLHALVVELDAIAAESEGKG